jgi:hypothetical protein
LPGSQILSKRCGPTLLPVLFFSVANVERICRRWQFHLEMTVSLFVMGGMLLIGQHAAHVKQLIQPTVCHAAGLKGQRFLDGLTARYLER